MAKTPKQLNDEIAAYLATPAKRTARTKADASRAKVGGRSARVQAAAGRTTRNQYVRSVLANRRERCDEDCPGWVPGDRGVERCDDCARLNGYADEINDHDIRALPEVRKAVARIYREANAGDG
jgi:hypothetical protein